MNVKRFTARNSRDALNLVKQAFGDDAVVLSTRQSADGVEVLAMAPDGMQQIEKVAKQAPTVRAPKVEVPQAAPVQQAAPAPAPRAAARPAARPAAAAQPARRVEPRMEANDVDNDVEQLAMSTLSFQDYVRERMLKRRQVEMGAPGVDESHVPAAPVLADAPAPRRAPPVLRDEIQFDDEPSFDVAPQAPVAAAPSFRAERDDMLRRDQSMMDELRSMKGLIEERFGALAFMEKLQRSPRQANLTQKLLDSGFSPALIRKLGEGLPADASDETAWAASVLERNLSAAEHEPALEDVGGVYALIGSTGVGKTTTTAKIAAAFAAKHGANNLGLITLDAYRVAAHEQLRTYGRILGVPVHTAHDRASLEDLLELLSGKKMVLIDTAGMAQRDARCRELLDMLSHRAIQKLLVVNTAAQGETIEDVMISYRAAACRGVVLSKMDEAVKMGPALDAVIRHKLKIVGVANGQRVPEDWHRLSAQALVQRALRASPAPSWRMDSSDVNLVFAGNAAMARRPVNAHLSSAVL